MLVRIEYNSLNTSALAMKGNFCAYAIRIKDSSDGTCGYLDQLFGNLNTCADLSSLLLTFS